MNSSHYLSINKITFRCDDVFFKNPNKSQIKHQECLLNKLILNITSLQIANSKKNSNINSLSILNNKLVIRTADGHEYTEHLNAKTIKIAKKILQITGNKVLTLREDKAAAILLASFKKANSSTQGALSTSIFYLYSSGGGGHVSAKEAVMETNLSDLLDKVKLECINGNLKIDPRLQDLSVFTKWCKQMGLVSEADVLHDYLGKVGKWASSTWNTAQQKGDVKALEKMASKQWLSDLFFGPFVFFSTLNSLKEHKPKNVVSTQAMATPAILLAIAVYNKFYKPKKEKDVTLHLYMTDMPTIHSTHFFNSLKNLGHHTGKKYLVLHAPKLGNDQSWEELCNMPRKQVKELDVKNLPVRPAFLKAINQQKYDPEKPLVKFKVSGNQELKLLNEVLKRQNYNLALSNPTLLDQINKKKALILDYPMQSTDKRCSIMLGSQPTRTAIEEYINGFIEMAKENPNIVRHIFICAGEFEEKSSCFYKDLCAFLIEKSADNNWPKNLHAIPLSYQDADQIVSLGLQCDTITRSGGSTSMEFIILDQTLPISTSKRRRMIHAEEVQGRGIGLEDLVKSIPLWERGNFYFLEETVGAKVIAPRYLKQVLNLG